MLKALVMTLMSISAFSYAGHAYLNEHEAGWYWHNDPIEEADKSKKKTMSPQASSQSATADKTWKMIGQMVAEARAKAILNPSVKNIATARRLQRIMVGQANLFSEKWMLDLLLHPEGDESLINPSGSAARDLYNQQNSLMKEKAIVQISQTSGLIYFYEGNEPFSERMAEVLRDFADSYHMKVIPIAMSPKFSPIFPQSHIDAGEANHMGVKHIPAVFAIHPVSKQPMPVAYGLVSQSELKDNILMATNAFRSGAYHEN